MGEKNWPHQIPDEEIRDRLIRAGQVESSWETLGFLYDRTEFKTPGHNLLDNSNIRDLHRQSFIEYIRERLEGEEFKQRKFRILDMGGGAGMYADQLKSEFGDRVKIYTTGLSKKHARNYRSFKDSGTMPKEYLKWRSILELNHVDEEGRPVEEFDLILNTFGEIPYNIDTITHEQNELWYDSYIAFIVSKLRPGGFASIYPVYPPNEEWLEKIKSELGDKADFEIVQNPVLEGENCLKIKKFKELDKKEQS